MTEMLSSLLYMLNEMSPYILLGFLIAGVIHAFVPQDLFAHHLSSGGWRSVVKAAAVGIPLPLCSCGVLPTAIGMRRKGASRAAATSFLISTPQTGIDSIAATWSLLGPAFAVIRPVAALITALIGGLAVGQGEKGEHANSYNHKHDEDRDHCGCHDHDEAHGHHSCHCCHDVDDTDNGDRSFAGKCMLALRYGFIDLVGSIGSWLIAGLLIAAVITVYVPADFFAITKSPLVSMILVLVIAIPMYVCATGSIPIAMSLVMKGLSPGTAFVLLMAGPAANFASFSLVAKEMGRKAAFVYLLSIIAGAMAIGLVIDYLLPARWFAIKTMSIGVGEEMGDHIQLFPMLCSIVLILLLVIALTKKMKAAHGCH